MWSRGPSPSVPAVKSVVKNLVLPNPAPTLRSQTFHSTISNSKPICPYMALKPAQELKRKSPGYFLLAFLSLVVILSLLFFRSFLPGYTVFSNDGPLGTLVSQPHRLPEGFTGGWQDLNSIGFREGGAFPNLTFALMWLLGPVGLSKFYAPIALLVLGLGAWCFFRRLGLAPLACVLGGLAATLNSGFFSAACWGVAAHP